MKEYGRIGQKRWEGQFYEEFLLPVKPLGQLIYD